MKKNKHLLYKNGEGGRRYITRQGVMETQEESIPTKKERSEVLSDTKGFISDFKTTY